jgi:hypothetical protein
LTAAEVRDLRRTPTVPWPHWTALAANTEELVDPTGERTLRVVGFERLGPGERTFMSPSYVPSHRNSYDVLYANVVLSLAGDTAEPVGGAVFYRPEGLFWPGGPGAAPQPVGHGRAEVNVYLHVTGPSAEPMVSLAEIAAVLPTLEQEGGGRVDRERGEYVDAAGTTHELLDVCWERIVGRPFRRPDPPPLDCALAFPLAAYPWRETGDRGVRCKRLASFGAEGPSLALVKLEAGGRLPEAPVDGYRFVAVLAGRVRHGGAALDDLHVVYGLPGSRLEAMIAEAPALLWVVEWRSRDAVTDTNWRAA